ncbi:hypothetical protein CIB48_g4202 [Xylaria polymorpha]|nr:hypothetical protein CIB48_g4202 [Xylaria polymorpha]
MLPVIFLVGSTSSGKGSLGQRLAAEFNLYHLSLGETYRALNRALRQPIPSMPEEINTCLVNQKEIPETALAQFKPGHVPVVLQLHNRNVQNSKEPNLSGEILRERIARLKSKRSIVPRAVIVDGLHSAFSRRDSTEFKQVLQEFAPSFSGLTIHIVCPKNVARSRYLQRARSSDSTVERFEERMLKYEAFTPLLLNMLKSEGVVVETVNDDTMTIDEAYQTLLKHLDGVPLWGTIIGLSPKAIDS